MPNGRHGAVLIPREELKQFLDSIPADPIVGKLGRAYMALADLKRLARINLDEEIFVEGQYDDARRAVVIHFRRKTWFQIKETWVWVLEDSAVFEALKEFWLGWLGRGSEE
jgi:hypothetical protein